MPVATAALLAGSALANVGGAVIGSISASGDRKKAQDAMNAAFQQINDIGAPPDLSAEIIRQNLQQAGVYTPQLEQAITQDVSKLSQVQEDPGLRTAQTQALQALQQRGAQGLTPVERQAFNDNRRKAAIESESKREQIIQNLAQRGMGGSGAEIAAQLGASQSGDQELAAQGDRLAAAASQNALQATAQAGQLGGQIRGQDFSVAGSKAQAEDALNQFNINNQIARQQRNISSQNQAQAANLGEQQRISDTNINAANAEKLRQANAKQQLWNSQAQLAGMKSNALTGQANNYQQQGDATAKQWQGAGSGVAGAIGAVGAQQQQENFFNKLLNKSAPASNNPQFAPIENPDVQFGSSSRKKLWYEE